MQRQRAQLLLPASQASTPRLRLRPRRLREPLAASGVLAPHPTSNTFRPEYRTCFLIGMVLLYSHERTSQVQHR